MTTLVGKQQLFDQATVALLELEYDALEAYEVAIDKLENTQYKQKMRDFKEDHQRHVKELSQLLTAHRISDIPTGPSGKQWLTKGKVALGSLMGDKAILLAMDTNEDDTNTAYERMVERDDIWAYAKDFLRGALADERKHKAWIEKERHKD